MSSRGLTTAVVMSTYNQPQHLEKALRALQLQTYIDFRLYIADDGSDEATRQVIDRHREGFKHGIEHLWQPDRGFRKTQILNMALKACDQDYLVVMDGDCVAHPDFLAEHRVAARPGAYLNGAMIRLNQKLTEDLNLDHIVTGEAFDPAWLRRKGGGWNRRYLRLSLPYRTRQALNQTSRTPRIWLGANSSCFMEDALSVNGFDNRFTYGFEDVDFGNRLHNLGLEALTVRWTANVLHLDHGRPYHDPESHAANLAMVTPAESGGRTCAEEGLEQLNAE